MSASGENETDPTFQKPIMTARPIRTLLIANRGEIAARIARTCRRLGIRSVAVHSDADAEAPFTREADEALRIGPAEPAASYLDLEALLDAARRAGADAVHPGYGFLSENAAFARAVIDAGLVWVGPHPRAIEAMGSKSRAKALMAEHGVPVVPGYRGEDQSADRLEREAGAIGFPLLVKAAAGGGGKGMRIVREAGALRSAVEAARREAAAAFGDDELLLEKYIESGRHVEFQIFGDRHGNVVHLLERECSIQRRYQKVVEESPSPALTPGLRERMGAAAVAAARALAYDNAGTVEFILEGEGDEARFYFLEVNTRLQVEHPVTELVTGLDLVEWQLLAAEGRPLPLAQEAVRAEGYAVQVRLYAEDPAEDYRPATGTVRQWAVPAVEGLRADSAVEAGSVITPHYDPMIAKLIVHGPDRATAHRRLAYALRQLVCLGTVTNRDFLRRIVEHPDFAAGRYDTHFLERHPELARPSAEGRDPAAAPSPGDLPAPGAEAALAAALHGHALRRARRRLLPALSPGWTNNDYGPLPETWTDGENAWPVRLRWRDGHEAEARLGEDEARAVRLLAADAGSVRFSINGHARTWRVERAARHAGGPRGPVADRGPGQADQGETCWLQHPEGGAFRLEEQERFPLPGTEAVAGGYEAPMPGQVLRVLVAEGQAVRAGDPLVVLLSMKMENTVAAAEDGTVTEVRVAEGQTIEAGHLLIVLDAAENRNETD